MSTKVFLCWSGTRSRRFAEILQDWLSKVLRPSLQPVVSTQIEKGSPWIDELRNALDNSDCGILCLTAEAVGSPWVHFEAGLLVRALSTSSKPGKSSKTVASATMKNSEWVSAVATGAAVVGVWRQSVYERYS